jgi:hypothetical protein
MIEQITRKTFLYKIVCEYWNYMPNQVLKY